MATIAQPASMFGEGRLGAVAEGEERLFGAEGLSGKRERDHFVELHRSRAIFARVATKRTVSAVVAAQRRQWNEYFGREGDDPAMASIAEGSRRFQQIRPLVTHRAHQCIALVARRSLPSQRSMNYRADGWLERLERLHLTSKGHRSRRRPVQW